MSDRMIHKLVLTALTAVAVFAITPGASADALDITLPTVTVMAGETGVAVFGTLTNLSADTVFLNGDTENAAAAIVAPGSVNDTPFFLNAPLSLAAGQSSGLIELFTFDVAAGVSPGLAGAGVFSGLGGVGAANSSNFDLLGSQHFSVNVQPATTGTVPEPGTLVYLGIGLAAMVAASRRFRARRVAGYKG